MALRFVFVAAALWLTGCATAENSLSVAEVASLRIEKVSIVYSPKAEIWWGQAERDYAEALQAKSSAKPKRVSVATDDAAAAASEHAKIVESPEARTAIRERLSGMVRQSIERNVLPNFKGTRGAHLEVGIVSFVIPSAAQRIVFGGTPMFGAKTVLKDSKTGAVLAKSDQISVGPSGNGLLGVAVDQAMTNSDLEDRVLKAYAASVNRLLTRQ